MAGEALTVEAVRLLSDPRISLPQFGTVVDQGTSLESRYSPTAITVNLQNRLLDYMAEPPRTDDGFTRWAVILKARQVGISTTAELAAYVQTAYRPSWAHVCIADTRERADFLHTRVQLNASRWPEELKVPPRNSNEIRKLEFEHGGGLRVLAGGSHAVGVGQSIDSLHLSECPLIPAFSEQWTAMLPAIQNRRNSVVVAESTPFSMSEPGSEAFRDLFRAAERGDGRLLALWEPYWDGKLNRREWKKEWGEGTNEEIRLIERYGHKGLQYENLAFRRFAMDMDAEIRRNPALFDVFFLSNTIDCWLVAGKSVIPSRAIERQSPHICEPIEKANGLCRYEEYDPNAVYALGADVAGHGKDHSAFHILKCYADEWTQAVSFGSNIDPLEFGELLMKEGRRYGNAKVLFERNGVGLGLSAQLRMASYPNVYMDETYKPGVHKFSSDAFIEAMVDALLDYLTIHDQETLAQLQTYRADKAVEQSQKFALLNPNDPGKGRRGRHHWDLVSALELSVQCARKLPKRFRAQIKESKPSSEMTYDEWSAYANQQQKDVSKASKSEALLRNRRMRRRL